MNIENYTPPKIPIISSQEALEEATALLSQLNKHLDAITADKELLTKPLNASLKAIKDKYKPAEESITTAIGSIKAAMTTYRTNVLAQQSKQIDSIAGRIERGTMNINTAMDKISAITSNVEDSKKVATGSGMISFRSYACWRIIDEKIIPRECLRVNDEAIKTWQKERPNNPPAGIEFYTEERPVNYRK